MEIKALAVATALTVYGLTGLLIVQRCCFSLRLRALVVRSRRDNSK
jgi:hypothetical protein